MPNAYDFDTSDDAELDDPIESPVKPAPAAKVSAPPDQVAQPKSEPAKHSATTLHFAKEFGFPQEMIDGATVEGLELAVRAAHSTMLKTRQDFTRNDIRERGGDKPAATSGAPASDAKPNPQPAGDGKPAVQEEDPFKEFEDELSPRVLAAIKKAGSLQKQTIEDLQAKLAEADSREQKRQSEALFDAVDKSFADLPAAAQAFVGKGTRHEIEDGSFQHLLRKSILKAAWTDQTPGLTLDAKIKKAANALIPGLASAPAPAPIPTEKPAAKPVAGTGFAAKSDDDREEAFRSGGVSKPTAREPEEPKGESRALKAARKIMLERGMLDEGDTAEDAFL